MNYYRKTVDNTANDLKLKMQMGALTLKLSENNGNISSNLTKIDNNESNISSNLTKINTNKNDISSNLTKINTNKNDISSNLTKINTNVSDISSNLTKINTNKNDISSNLTKIDNNESNISSNLTKINTNVSDISSNLTKINTNKNDISSNLTKINTNKNDISSNLTKINTNVSDISTLKKDVSNNFNFTQINKKKSDNNSKFIDTNRNNITTNLNKINTIDNYYKLKDITIFDIEKTNIPETIDISNPKFVIIQSSLNNLKKDSYLQFESSILAFFNKHYINIGFFHMLLEYFNEEDVLIEECKLPIIGMVSKHCIITNSCIIKLTNDLDKIYFKLSIKLNEGQNRTDSISILDFYNHICFKIFEN